MFNACFSLLAIFDRIWATRKHNAYEVNINYSGAKRVYAESRDEALRSVVFKRWLWLQSDNGKLLTFFNWQPTDDEAKSFVTVTTAYIKDGKLCQERPLCIATVKECK